MRLVLALFRIGLKTGPGLSQSLGMATAIASLLSTVMHVTFQHCITLNRQCLPNSKFNIQSVTNNSPSQASYHPDDLFQSGKDNDSNIWNGHLPLYSPTWLNNTIIVCLITSHSKFVWELWQFHKEVGNSLTIHTLRWRRKSSGNRLDGFIKRVGKKCITDQMGKSFKSTSTYA